jgi:drug/metabolite transporter (DMT)-like permease
MVGSSAVLELRGVRRRGQTYVALAALAWYTAGVLQRQLSIDTATQVLGRAFFAAIALLAAVAVLSRGDLRGSFRAGGLHGLAVAGCTAVASGTFIVAINETTVANVLFMQAVSPVAAALIAWLAFRDPVSRRSVAAMGIALAGVALMVGGPGGAHGAGLALSVVMTLSFAGGLVITRHRRDISMLPAGALSQLLVILAFLPFAHPGSVGGHDLALLVALGAGQIGLGLGFVTVGARLIPAAEVALITLLEVVLGPLWVWLAESERPGAGTLVGGAVVVVAVVLQATEHGARA